ncbi:MAG: hypothetical protein AAF598_15960 [Bacteroidota bacterium]
MLSLTHYFLLLPVLVIVVYKLYDLNGFFLYLSVASKEEIEAEMTEVDDGTDPAVVATWMNRIGALLFTLIGIYLWSVLAIVSARLVSLLPMAMVWKVLVYLLVYFLCLRMPFGVAHKSLRQVVDLDRIPNQTPFALTMIAAFFLSIFAFDYLPGMFTWPLFWLANG